MTDKRQKATKVKCKRDESIKNQSIFVEYILIERNIWILLELVRRWTQHFTKIDQKKRKIEPICIWKPIPTGFIM